MFNIILIGLSKELKEKEDEQELHRLLGVLLSPALDAEKKLGIMEAEFEIPVEDGIRRNVGEMCNLSDNIWDEALLIGEEKGKAEGKAETIISIVLQMERRGFSSKEIADILDQEEAEIQAILLGKTPVLV